jgi:hypothetical protein
VAQLGLQLKINPPAYASLVLISQVYTGMPADSVLYLIVTFLPFFFFFFFKDKMTLEVFATILYGAFNFLLFFLLDACVWVVKVCPVL